MSVYTLRRGAVDDRLRRDLAGVERGGRGDHLEGGARLVELLRRPVEQRLVGVAVDAPELGGDQVRVVLGDRHHHAHLAGLRLDRDDRALAPGEAVDGGVRAGHVEVRDHVVALAVAALQTGEDRGELVLVARQVVVAVELEPAPAVLDERVAERVGEGAARRIAAGVGPVLSAPLADAARQHRAVRGEDQPARDLLLLDQRPPVVRVVRQRLGLEHGPARGEDDQDREQQREEPEELDDLAVHTSPPRRLASERAWSDTIRSSASSTMFATIELPP